MENGIFDGPTALSGKILGAGTGSNIVDANFQLNWPFNSFGQVAWWEKPIDDRPWYASSVSAAIPWYAVDESGDPVPWYELSPTQATAPIVFAEEAPTYEKGLVLSTSAKWILGIAAAGALAALILGAGVKTERERRRML
jgi:hypothetical protein